MAEVTGETVKQDSTEKTPERTFTQTEMNAIIGERLERERAKYADYDTLKDKAAKFDAAEEASKTDLEKERERADGLKKQLDQLTRANSIREIREKVARETGVPVETLSGEDEESCKAQADAILRFAKADNSYAPIQDAGEAVPPTGKKSNRDVFAAYMNNFLNK